MNPGSRASTSVVANGPIEAWGPKSEQIFSDGGLSPKPSVNGSPGRKIYAIHCGRRYIRLLRVGCESMASAKIDVALEIYGGVKIALTMSGITDETAKKYAISQRSYTRTLRAVRHCRLH